MAYSLRGCESKVARESPPVFTEIYQHPPGNNRESSRGRQAAREKNRVLGGEEIPPKTLFFSVFSRVLGALRGPHGAGCEDFLGGVFLGWGFCLGFFRNPKPKPQTQNLAYFLSFFQSK